MGDMLYLHVTSTALLGTELREGCFLSLNIAIELVYKRQEFANQLMT